jgi:hypothetical protein
MADTEKSGGAAQQAAGQADSLVIADIQMKIATEYALRARHHDLVRAMIDVGLITFTSLSYVLYAAIYARPDANVYILFAIAILVITLGVFGIAFTAGREIAIRRWLAASDAQFRAASESAGFRGGEIVQAHSRLLTYIVYALMAAAMIAPGAILVYASWDLVR